MDSFGRNDNNVQSHISFGNNQNCVVYNDGTYSVDGVFKGRMSPQQYDEYQEYQRKVQDWSKSLQESLPFQGDNQGQYNFSSSSRTQGVPENVGNNWPFGPNADPFNSSSQSFTQSAASQSRQAHMQNPFGDNFPFGSSNTNTTPQHRDNQVMSTRQTPHVPSFPGPPSFLSR